MIEIMNEEPMKIKIKYADGMKEIYQAHEGEWYDLRAAEDINYITGDIVCVPLGVAMELPEGYEAIMRPRSSLCRKRGLVFADSGVIDNAYCGDNDFWNACLFAVRSGKLYKNDRICQFRIQKIQPEVEFVKVNHLGNVDRGGYGSTGVK